MDQSLSFDDDAISMIYAEEVATSFQNQMQEVELLANELHNLLKSYGVPIDQEGSAGTQPEGHVGRWAECYRRGLMAASKIRRNGDAFMHRATKVLNKPVHTEALSGKRAGCNSTLFRAMEFEDDDIVHSKGSIVAQRRNMLGQTVSGTAPAR